jgi:hypothetical protein
LKSDENGPEHRSQKKRLFSRIEQKADGLYAKTRNMELVLKCMAAIDNATETASEHGFKGDPEDYPEYWEVAVATLESILSDRSIPRTEVNWFRKQGLTI